MSRSNPTESSPHPCARWIEWSGAEGHYRYYDKEKKESVTIGDDLTFMLLDTTSTIKGWHEGSESGIFSNEVRDIQQDVLVVKAFKGGTLAEGTYKSIRDKIIASGGHFTANLYAAVKIDGELAIASIQFKGAALRSWMEFCKTNRSELYKKAIRCKGFEEGRKGKIVYKTPLFNLSGVSPETDAAAISCDHVLQEFLKSYFSRTRIEQAVPAAENGNGNGNSRSPYDNGGVPAAPPHKGGAFDDLVDDIPF